MDERERAHKNMQVIDTIKIYSLLKSAYSGVPNNSVMADVINDWLTKYYRSDNRKYIYFYKHWLIYTYYIEDLKS